MKKYPLDKIVLLGFFIGSLLIARLIIASKSTISLTDPIELDYSGLSVSMPIGDGWNAQKQWMYKDGTYILSGICMPIPANLTDMVYCRYLVNPEHIEPEKLFEQKVVETGGRILRKNRIATGKMVVDFVHIGEKNSKFNVLFGVASLPYERRLEIEVHQTAGDVKLARKIFKRIVGNLKFEDNHLLEAASKVVSEIRETGLVELSKDTDRLIFFSFTDAQNMPFGFTMDEVILLPDNSEFNVQAETLLYVRRGRYAKEQTAFFQGSNNLDKFTWKYTNADITGINTVEMLLERNSIVIVKKSATDEEKKNYQLGSAAIPEIFLGLVFNQMLDSGQEEILIDVIESEGRITPLLISKITGQDYILEIKLLDGSDFLGKIALDDQRRVFRKLLTKEQITLERTSLENILKQFPEKSGYIRQKTEMLEQNQL